MADFDIAFEISFKNEGALRLTKIKNDKGGQTFAGIARISHPEWVGWAFVDRGENPGVERVKLFFRENYWNPIFCSSIQNQRIANNLFDFSINTGIPIAVKLLQKCLGITSDGVIGPITLEAINTINEDALKVDYIISLYTLSKIARYRDIVAKDKTQLKFLLGWINRALAMAHE